MSNNNRSRMTINSDLHAKAILYHPWKYYGEGVEDRMIAELHLLDLIHHSPPTATHEQSIRQWVRNEGFVMEYGPGGLLLGILIKYRASFRLTLDLLRECPRLLYTLPENPKKLCVLGFALYVDADPTLIQDMMALSGFRISDLSPKTISWHRISLRAVEMLLQDHVRFRMGPENHDKLLMLLLSKPSTLERIEKILRCWENRSNAVVHPSSVLTSSSSSSSSYRTTIMFARRQQYVTPVSRPATTGTSTKGSVVGDNSTAQATRTASGNIRPAIVPPSPYRQSLLWTCLAFWRTMSDRVGCGVGGSGTSRNGLTSVYMLLRQDPSLIANHNLNTALLDHPTYKLVCQLQLRRERLRQQQQEELASVDDLIFATEGEMCGFWVEHEDCHRGNCLSHQHQHQDPSDTFYTTTNVDVKRNVFRQRLASLRARQMLELVSMDSLIQEAESSVVSEG